MHVPDDHFNTLEDFLNNPRFRKWVLGEMPEEQHFWKQWLLDNQTKRPLYEKAVATLLVIKGNEILIASSDDSGSKEIINALNTVTNPGRTLTLWRYAGWAAAAMVVISLGFYWRSIQKNDVPGQPVASIQKDSAWLFVENTHKEVLLVNLPDGSSVLLSKGSNIRFEKVMTKAERVVHLNGEGFFEVVKNPEKPFFVYANKLVTKVLGTSFRIKSYPGQSSAMVAVKTGKVSVITNADQKGVTSQTLTLMPNQQLNLVLDHNQLLKPVSEPVLAEIKTPIQKEPFEFRFTPVSEAFKTLEINYGVKITYDRGQMGNCTLTASLKDEPFLEKIRLICLATESTYELTDGHVVINGAGCP
jgi:transmembrane sensor